MFKSDTSGGLKIIIPLSALVLVFIFNAAIVWSPMKNYDIWWHIKTGEYILQQGKIPHTDPFSYTTKGRVWFIHEWLFQVAVYLIHSYFGFASLTMLKVLCATLTLLVLAHLLWRMKVSVPVIFLVLALFTFFCAGFWMVRPQSVALLMLVILLHRLLHPPDMTVAEKNTLLFSALLFLVWVNVHSSFVLGIFLYVVHILLLPTKDYQNHRREAWKRKTILIAVPLLITLINPQGAKAWLYPIMHLAAQNQGIIEWQSPPLFSWFGLSLLLGVFLWMISCFLTPRRPKPIEYVCILLGSLLGWSAVRHMPVYFLLLSPFLGLAIQNLIERNKWFQRLFTLVWAISILGICVLTVQEMKRGTAFHSGYDYSLVPRGAAEFIIKTRPAGNIFNFLRDGGYLIYTLWPKYKVFYDGRLMLHGYERYQQFRAIIRGTPDFSKILAQWNIHTAIVRYRDDLGRTGLGYRFQVDPRWKLVYADNLHAVYLDISNKRNREIIHTIH